jgi:hypothetical protein
MLETLQRLLGLSSFYGRPSCTQLHNSLASGFADDGHEENGAFDDLPVLRQNFVCE